VTGIWNLYWDELAAEFQSFPGPFWYGDWWKMEAEKRKDFSVWERKNYYHYRFAFAIPNTEAIAALLALGPIVEVGAGSGYWAEVLARAGADVAAYDDGSWHLPWTAKWYEVQAGGPEAITWGKRPVLLLCWPDYGSDFAARCEQEHRKTGGTWLAYIGEGEGGCTGDDAFHDALNAHWEQTMTVDIPQWPGLHDRLEIYRRKGAGTHNPGV